MAAIASLPQHLRRNAIRPLSAHILAGVLRLAGFALFGLLQYFAHSSEYLMRGPRMARAPVSAYLGPFLDLDYEAFTTEDVSRIVTDVGCSLSQGYDERCRSANVSSVAGKEGNPNAAAHSAAKAGVLALTKSLGKELAGHDISVHALTPSPAKTRILEQLTPEQVSEPPRICWRPST
jgi:NAD(P)-dependent dehydrogenase (short-subunit alcohol dehydrogenase family)